jgi:hypothetical protein
VAAGVGDRQLVAPEVAGPLLGQEHVLQVTL